MTKPTHSLTPEQERAINEVLCRFMVKCGEWREGWRISPASPGNPYDMDCIIFVPIGYERFCATEFFTRSADTLRLVEERLDEEQWEGYAMRVCIQALTKPVAWSRAIIEGAQCFAKAPVSLRAAALKEVVGE